MPSCSNSSNISSSLNAFTVVQGGSRLSTEIKRVSGLTFGSVVRYDVLSGGYTAAKADDAASSEVFGVVEGYNSTSDNFNVIIYGSINLSSSALYDMGDSGGSGGSDIYFLSGTTAGVLQNLAPTNLNHIIKPVYQAAPHGSFTGVVMNYLGYRIGGDIEASLKDTELGNVQIIIGSDQFQNGYVDAKISHELEVVDVPEFYQRFNRVYGYTEGVIVLQTLPSLQVGYEVYQSGNLIGVISGWENATKLLRIKKKPNTNLISTSSNLIIRSSTSQIAVLTPVSTSVVAVYTPIVRLPQPLILAANDGSAVVSQLVSVGIKVKPQGIKISVPNNITVSSVITDAIALGITWADLGTKIADFETRITALENG